MTASLVLEGAPRIAFVRSAPLARLLHELLLADDNPPVNGEKVRGALVDTVFRPRADVLRQDDVQDVVGDLWRKVARADGLYNLGTFQPRGVLTDLAFASLEHMGGHYEVRPQWLESYCGLIREIDPNFLVAVRHLHHLCTGELDVAALEAGLDRQSALAMPTSDFERPHADNHVHLYGVGITAHPLAGLLFHSSRSEEETTVAFDPALGISNNSERRALERLLCAAARYMVEFAIAGAERNTLSTMLLEQSRELREGCRPLQAKLIRDRLKGRTGLNTPQQLALAMACEADAQNAGRALQMLATLALYLHATVDLGERRLHRSVLAYIHALHLLRSCIIVSGVGLRTFVGYYGNAIRYRGNSFADRDRWRALLGGGADMVDAKISTTSIGNFRAYAQATAEAAAGIGGLLSSAQHGWQRYHLSFHFLRGADRGGGARPTIHFERERRRAEKTAGKLRRMLESVVWEKSDHPASGPIRQNVASWIRSFDIAGDETRTPVEVFAPALRWLRDKPIVQIIDGRPRVCPRRFFSIHAGEDFSHILSGLRHIEETVEFCALAADDRIGHGLALGLDPQDWARRQGVAIVPLQVHVDNLVWLWHHATLLAHQVETAARLLPQLHRRLDLFLHELHGGEQPALEILYRAWRLRRNCPHRLMRESTDANLADAIYWTPDLVEEPGLRNQREFAEYRRYLILPEAEAAQRRGMERVRLRLGRTGPSGRELGELVDHVSSDELELLAAVQDRLMTVIDAKGIMIEACPTSNLFIGKLPSYDAHPLFRWDPPDPAALAPGGRFNRFGLRTGPVTVCLNTDDPAIMPTTILTEHHLLREAAVRSHNVSRAAAAVWIDRIRVNGVDLFRRTHRDTDLSRAE